MDYRPRVVDLELDDLLTGVAAIALEGPKGVGKTATALRRATTVHRLDDPDERELARADLRRLAEGARPVLIDEWQRLAAVWDMVRRAVDDDGSPGHFILTGSATPAGAPVHSGAGRIVTLRMRPMALSERGLESPTVSLRSLLSGTRPPISGTSRLLLADYAREIVVSGFPGIRDLGDRARRAQLDGYLSRIAEREFPDLGHRLRNPAALRRWMTAYAAATSTTATFETIREAATGGAGEKPSRSAVQLYLDTLERLWIVEPVPAWLPTRSTISRLAAPPKHQMADPALAARLLGIGAEGLLGGRSTAPAVPRAEPLMGTLFESLVTMSVRVYAQAAEAPVMHLRTKGGEREVDLVVERDDRRVLALEVKLGRTVNDADTRHLLWLRDQLGGDLLDAVVVTTGETAYRRQDGIAVVPASLLGP
jgi:predicted AAA+ superfamily ATPase